MFCKEFIEPSGLHEGLFVGSLWNNPKLYRKYKNDQLTQYNDKTNEGLFTKKDFYFLYKLGEQMYSSGVQSFNETTVYAFISSQPDIGSFNWLKTYNKYGGFNKVQQLIDDCADNGNESYHYSEIQKFSLLRYYENNGLLNPEKEIKTKKGYVKIKNMLCEMNLEKVKSYFNLVTKKGSISAGTNNIKVSNFSDGLDDSVKKFNKGESMGLPLYGSPRLSRLIKGWKDGNFIFLVLSSGVGKSSFSIAKFAIPILESSTEKAFWGVNEENKERFHHTLLSTVSNSVVKSPITRERLSEGNFSQDEWDSINKSKCWIESKPSDKIKFAEIERFYLDEYLETLEMYRSLGYNKGVLDTFKPDASKQEQARWEKFSAMSVDIFDCVKPSANNIGMLATLQLKIGMDVRYLDLDCIGKAKEVVEPADVIIMGRLLFADEYDGSKLKVYDYVDDGTGSFHAKEIILDESKEYAIFFIPKNRNGSKTEQVVYEIDYNTNDWVEVGYARMKKSAR